MNRGNTNVRENMITKGLKVLITLSMMLGCFSMIAGNSDTLVLKNKDVLVGEIKGMSKSVVVFETDYSDSDFKIKWLEIQEVKSSQVFMITLGSGRLLHATISSTNIDGKSITLESKESGSVTVILENIVDIEPFDNTIWSRVDISLDFGYTYTRASNLQQLSTRSTIGYLGNRWAAHVSYDMVRSVQDSVDPIRRTNAMVDYEYYLKHNYFILASLSFLQNDEQKLDLRSTTRLGLGKFLVRNNRLYLTVAAGGAWNNERFSDAVEPDRNSAEAFGALIADLFNTGDLSLKTSIVGYPSLTESGRFRSDFKFDMKYDLPLDFYVRLGFTLNYDNQPVAGAVKSDYVLQTSIGWSW